MTNEQLAQKYVNRLNKCFAAIKILIICAIVAVAALVIFAVIAVAVSMPKSNPDGMLLGVIIPGAFAVVCIIGAFSALVTAKIVMSKFKKLGADKS